MQAVPAHVSGDPKRLRQVLLILLDNALQHTPDGGLVRLEATLQGKEVLITVEDSGVGIAREHLEHIFERFYQVETSLRELQRSNGLGLSIAKALVEKHHGAIRVESQVGQGSKFIITLPVVNVQGK
jgi:signal transduction histidine kinase